MEEKETPQGATGGPLGLSRSPGLLVDSAGSALIVRWCQNANVETYRRFEQHIESMKLAGYQRIAIVAIVDQHVHLGIDSKLRETIIQTHKRWSEYLGAVAVIFPDKAYKHSILRAIFSVLYLAYPLRLKPAFFHQNKEAAAWLSWNTDPELSLDYRSLVAAIERLQTSAAPDTP